MHLAIDHQARHPLLVTGEHFPDGAPDPVGQGVEQQEYLAAGCGRCRQVLLHDRLGLEAVGLQALYLEADRDHVR